MQQRKSVGQKPEIIIDQTQFQLIMCEYGSSVPLSEKTNQFEMRGENEFKKQAGRTVSSVIQARNSFIWNPSGSSFYDLFARQQCGLLAELILFASS